MTELWPKYVCPNMGMDALYGHVRLIWACTPYMGMYALFGPYNLAKYQHFWMTPTLFDLY